MMNTVYVQDVKDHRVHRRYSETGVRGLRGREDEHDTSGAYIVLTDAEMERIPPEWLCNNCFSASPALEVIG
jgi:hypothetical protein